MNVRVNINTNDDTAYVVIGEYPQAVISISHIGLGETDELTVGQAEAKARAISKRALEEAITSL